MKPEKLSDDQIQNIVTLEVRGAVSFCEAEVHDDRIKARRYMEGECDVEREPGRSGVVATVVRDTVRLAKPALMKIFMQDDPVEFSPRRNETAEQAKQITEYCKKVFWSDNPGYLIASAALDDALVEKTGVSKVFWDDAEEAEFDEYSNMAPEEWEMLQALPDVEIASAEQGEDGLWSAQVYRAGQYGCLKVQAVAPEDLFVDPAATSIYDARVIGDSCEMTVGDLVEMGFDFEEVYDLGSDSGNHMRDEADYARNNWSSAEWEQNTTDKSQRPVVVTDLYMKMDADGTGVARWWHLTCAGSSYKVLDREPCDENPYVVGQIDPRPHSFFGRSLAEILLDDTDAATSIRRALIDNMHSVNNPRTVVTESVGNYEDAADRSIGATMGQKGPGGYEVFAVPPTSAAILPVVQHHEMTIERKTGLSQAAAGIDADALTNTSATAANYVHEAQTAQVELMARNWAETYFRPLFTKMAKLIRQHAHASELMRINGQEVEIDPRSWTADTDVKVNVGLGSNRHEEKVMALQETMAMQAQVLQTLGVGNPLVSLAHVRAARDDLNQLRGVYDTDRYFFPLDPNMEQQFNAAVQQAAQQMAAQQGQGGGEYLAAEQMKTQQREAESQRKSQIEAMKAQAENQRKWAEFAAKDDLARDKLVQDLALEVAKIFGNTGVQVDATAIQQAQAATGPQGI